MTWITLFLLGTALLQAGPTGPQDASPRGTRVRRFPLDAVLGSHASGWLSAGATTRRSGWFDGVTQDSDADPNLLPVERWLDRHLPKDCPGVTRVTFIRTSTRRYTTERHRLIELSSIDDSTSFELEVEGTEQSLAAVEDVLAGLAAQSRKVLTVESHILSKKSDEPSSPLDRTSVRFLSLREFEGAVAEAHGKPGSADARAVTSIAAPRITTLQGQTGTLTVSQEVSYVKDYVLHVGDRSKIVDPIVDVVQDGLLLKVEPVIHPDGKTLTLGMTLTLADLVEPIREVEMEIEGHRVKREIPEVRTSHWDSGILEIPAGQTRLAVRGLKHTDRETHETRDVEVLVGVTIGELSDGITLGRVLAVDEATRTVIVEASSGNAAPARGSRLTVVRGDEAIATLEVGRIEGTVWITRLIDGPIPKPGDPTR